MRNILLLFLLISISLPVFSQFIAKKEKYHKLEAGFHTNGISLNIKDPVTFDKTYFLGVGTEPFIGFYPTKGLGVGVSAYYFFVKSDIISLPPLFAVGIYTKYYIPFKINRKFLKKFDFFVECNYQKTNHLFSKNQPVYEVGDYSFSYPFVYKKLSQTNINFPVGFNLNIFKKLSVEVSLQYIIFPQGSNMLGTRLGLNYYFYENTY